METVTFTISVVDGFVPLFSLIVSISFFLVIRWVIGTIS